MTESGVLLWYMSLREYMMFHVFSMKSRPKTLQLPRDVALLAVRTRRALTYTKSGMSIWIHAPFSCPNPVTSVVTPDKPDSASAYPSVNSSPDVHAENESPSNAKKGLLPSAELDAETM